MALSKEQLAKINEKVSSGDKEAMKFIVDYPSMSEEEANAYLAKIAVIPTPNQSKEDLISMNEFLIKDENEATNGYDKGILLAENCGNKKAQTIYETIKNQELDHINLLKELNNCLVEDEKEKEEEK